MTDTSKGVAASPRQRLSLQPVTPPAPEEQDKSWQDLAREASEETDPQKLITIVKDLCSALDEEAKPPESVKNAEPDLSEKPELRRRSG